MPGRAPHRSKSEKRIQNFWTGKDIECHVDLPLWPVGESGWAVRRRRRKKEGRERLGDLSLPDLLCFSLFTCLVFLFAALIWAARYFPNQRNSKLRNCFVLFCFFAQLFLLGQNKKKTTTTLSFLFMLLLVGSQWSRRNTSARGLPVEKLNFLFFPRRFHCRAARHQLLSNQKRERTF